MKTPNTLYPGWIRTHYLPFRQILQHLNVSVSTWLESVCLKSSLHGTIYDELDISFVPRYFFVVESFPSQLSQGVEQRVGTGTSFYTHICQEREIILSRIRIQVFY
jgi:hypothetical protein